MIKLILTDMDGTLLNSRHQMPEKTLETVKWLQGQGIRFGLASGREYENIRSYFPGLEDELLFIADNGTLVYDGLEEIYADPISSQGVIQMVEAIGQIPETWSVLCGKDLTYIECPPQKREAIEALAPNFYKNIQLVEDACAIARQKTILEISIFCERDTRPVEEALAWVKQDYQLYVSGKNWIDILNKSAGKGNALKKIQAKYGLKPEECMAFGDYLNDKEMLENVGISYAMANAHPEILQVAKYKAPSNEEGGVIRVIRRYFQLDD